MREKLVSCGQTAVLLMAAFCLAGANDPKKANYVGGDADTVKGWGAKDFAEAKASGQPMFIYIYDPKYDHNQAAKYFEAKEVLGSTEFREQLKPFLCAKLKGDGSDSKGWPGDWLGHSFHGAALVLTTSDFARKVIYDKQNKESVGGASLAAQLKAYAKYEEELKTLIATTKLAPGPVSEPKPATPAANPADVNDKPAKAPPSALEEKKDEKKPEKKKKTIDGPADE